VVHILYEVKIHLKNNKENEFIELTKKAEVLGKILEFTKKGGPNKCYSEDELNIIT